MVRNAQDPEFAQWVNGIGDGTSQQVFLDFLDLTTDTDQLLEFVYPDTVLHHPPAYLHCSILAPTNKQVTQYNDALLERIPGNA